MLNVLTFANVDEIDFGLDQRDKIFIELTKSNYLQISRKPEGIDDVGAAGTLFVGLTVWSSLYISGLVGGFEGLKTSKGSLRFFFQFKLNFRIKQYHNNFQYFN